MMQVPSTAGRVVWLWLVSHSCLLPPCHPRPHGCQPRSALSLVKVPLDGTRISKMVPALDCAHGRAGRWWHRPLAVLVSGASYWCQLVMQRSPLTAGRACPSPLGELPPQHHAWDKKKQGLPGYTPPSHLVPAQLASVALRPWHPQTSLALGFHP